MNGFLFLDGSIEINNKTFYARLYPNIPSKNELFKCLYYSCRLPTYFGHNWDALDEVLRDFGWIVESNIIIQHKNVPQMSQQDLKIYFAILAESFEYFQEGDKNIFYVFSTKDRLSVSNILEELGYENFILN